MRKLIPIYAILTALTLIVSASCNSSGNGDNEPTVVSANTLVSNFRLQKNDSVMTLLDSIPFTIDVNRRLIYNPDSLPKGTDITRLVASISLASSTSVGEISISGATTMKDTPYMVAYTSSTAKRDELVKLCKKAFGHAPMIVFQLGGVVSANTGPDGIAIVYEGKPRNLEAYTPQLLNAL